MYDIPHFKEIDKDIIKAFIQEHSFAVVVGHSQETGMAVTQLPVFLEEREGKWFLSGHFMKGTDHHRAFEEGDEVLAVFAGPHTYVSATWYQQQNRASTWNYMSVYLKGRMRLLGEEALKDILQKTTLHIEKGRTGSPTVYNNLPESYTRPLLRAIVAFEIEVTHQDHVFKLSQNQDEVSYENIIEQLKKGDEAARKIAFEMEKRRTSERRKLENKELDRLDVEGFKLAEKFPITVILDQVRSLHNVGSVFRSCDAFRIEKLYLCGITATPPHKDIQKTALGATETVDWAYEKDTLDLVIRLQSEGVKVLAVEQAEGSTMLDTLELKEGERYAVIFGNEVKGVSQEVVSACDGVVEIPQFGTKHSLNIAVSAGVVLWEMTAGIRQRSKEAKGLRGKVER